MHLTLDIGGVNVGLAYYERAVNFFQDILLQQSHFFTMLCLQALLAQLLAGVHLASVLDLHGTHLEASEKLDLNFCLV